MFEFDFASWLGDPITLGAATIGITAFIRTHLWNASGKAVLILSGIVTALLIALGLIATGQTPNASTVVLWALAWAGAGGSVDIARKVMGTDTSG